MIDEVKFKAIPFSEINLAIILNDTSSKSISLHDKGCTLRDGTKVACREIHACLKNNGTTAIPAIGESLVGRNLFWFSQTNNFQQILMCSGSSIATNLVGHERSFWKRRGNAFAITPFVWVLKLILSNVILSEFILM